MRVRTDSWYVAGWKRAALVGGRDDVAEDILNDPIPAAELGDVWVIRFDGDSTQSHDGKPDDWPIVGYAMTCPIESCEQGVHDWTWAHNCGQKLPEGGSRCAHMRDRTSCWTWTGSAEDGTLSATPSLHSPTDLGGCGFHGYLTNGVLA